MNIFFPFLLFFLLLDLQTPVYASIGKSRKHSTAHYFANGTLIVLGGIEPDLNTTKTQFASPVLSLLFNSEDLSLTSSTIDPSPLLQSISGHTSHYDSSSGSLFSVFGIDSNEQYSPPIQSHFTLFSPSAYLNLEEKRQNEIGRQHHSSAYSNSTLYVFGGYYIRNGKKQLENDSLIMYRNKTTRTIKFPSMYGHSTIQYQQWLISCFGYQEQNFNHRCVWFDTVSLSVNKVSFITPEGPAARTYASMIPIKDGHYLLYGGETGENEILNDIWELIILQPFKMTWKKLERNTKGKKRSGHVGISLSNEIILYFGGSGVEEGDISLFFNITSMNWIETHSERSQLLIKREENVSSTPSASLNGGGIAGIVIGILILLGVIYLLWRRFGQKKIRTPSRATRFQPQIPLQRPAVNEIPPPLEEQQQQQQQQQQQPFVLSLPEIALSSNSRLSLGPNFGYLPGSNKSETSLQSISESKSRTSSVFPARKSYLYPPPTPRTPDSTFSNSVRGSVSAKSVSSVQWVGFNDNMDYSSNDIHLSVANRASNYYSDTSAQTTPQTPMFPNYLKDNYEKNISKSHFDK